MEPANLGLEVGDSLQLQFLNDGPSSRQYVKVIGCHSGRSILVTTPQIGGRIMLVRQDQPVVVRIMIGTDVVGFNSWVIRSCARPYPYLHLAYPKELRSSSIRAALRVGLDQVVSIRKLLPDDDPNRAVPAIAARTRDISISGALICAPNRLGDLGERLLLAMRVTVAGFAEEIRLRATVCNRTVLSAEHSSDETLFGVEFDPPDRREAVVLHAYVYQTILCNLGKIAAPFPGGEPAPTFSADELPEQLAQPEKENPARRRR